MDNNDKNGSSGSWIDSGFIDTYLDYREGITDKPPTFDGLSEEQRRGAQAWIQSREDVRRIDPYAVTPTIEELANSNPQLKELLVQHGVLDLKQNEVSGSWNSIQT